MLAKIVGTLCQVSVLFLLLPPPPHPPCTMLSYCVFPGHSLASCPKCVAEISYLQETGLFWGRGLFIAPKSCSIKRSYEEEILLQSWLVYEAFQLLLASVQKKSRLHGCEPEEGFLNLCLFEEGPVILERNLM